MAPYCDVQFVSVVAGFPGKLIVNRSSALANSFHSAVALSAVALAEAEPRTAALRTVAAGPKIAFAASELLSIPFASVRWTRRSQDPRRPDSSARTTPPAGFPL